MALIRVVFSAPAPLVLSLLWNVFGLKWALAAFIVLGLLASDAARFVTGAVLVADGGGRVATHARGF